MTTTWQEHPVVFECEGCRLVGVIAAPSVSAKVGVVIIVGGPQYRAGSHRQFTLLARGLAEQGIASIRFDYRGMGDSEGDLRYFEAVNADVKASIDTLLQHIPSISKVALWGLCDAASAAMFYAATDKRVTNLVLLNPWVHTPAGAAKARLKYYYLSRLMQRSFWVKLLSGKVRISESAQGLAQASRQASANPEQAGVAPADPRHGSAGYVDRMYSGLQPFSGNVLFLLSEQDLVAKEFVDLTKQDKRWRKVVNTKRVTTVQIKDANHTFSSQTWRAQVTEQTAKWLLSECIF